MQGGKRQHENRVMDHINDSLHDCNIRSALPGGNLMNRERRILTTAGTVLKIHEMTDGKLKLVTAKCTFVLSFSWIKHSKVVNDINMNQLEDSKNCKQWKGSVLLLPMDHPNRQNGWCRVPSKPYSGICSQTESLSRIFVDDVWWLWLEIIRPRNHRDVIIIQLTGA